MEKVEKQRKYIAIDKHSRVPGASQVSEYEKCFKLKITQEINQNQSTYKSKELLQIYIRTWYLPYREVI